MNGNRCMQRTYVFLEVLGDRAMQLDNSLRNLGNFVLIVTTVACAISLDWHAQSTAITSSQSTSRWWKHHTLSQTGQHVRV